MKNIMCVFVVCVSTRVCMCIPYLTVCVNNVYNYVYVCPCTVYVCCFLVKHLSLFIGHCG